MRAYPKKTHQIAFDEDGDNQIDFYPEAGESPAIEPGAVFVGDLNYNDDLRFEVKCTAQR